MNNTDKIKLIKNWLLNTRISIINATYRQALSYKENLRVQGVKDLYNKPKEAESYL